MHDSVAKSMKIHWVFFFSGSVFLVIFGTAVKIMQFWLAGW